MQLICETLLPPRISVAIIFWTLTNYTLQSIVIVATAIFMPVYLFIARQSRDRMSGLTGCQAVNSRPPKFACVTHQILIGHFWTDLLAVFSIIICSSQAIKISTTGSAPHFRFQSEIPNFNYKICPISKYNLHFLHKRLEFRNKIFTPNFYILLAADRKNRAKLTVRKLNRKP